MRMWALLSVCLSVCLRMQVYVHVILRLRASYLYGFVVERARAATADVNALRDQYQRGDFAGMATAFGPLGYDQVYPCTQRLFNVLRVADHIPYHHPASVKLVDRPARGHADGADEECRALGDDDVDELWQVAMRVVVVGFARVATDLGDGEVYPERPIRVIQVLRGGTLQWSGRG